jgi:hypothetical protein
MDGRGRTMSFDEMPDRGSSEVVAHRHGAPRDRVRAPCGGARVRLAGARAAGGGACAPRDRVRGGRLMGTPEAVTTLAVRAPDEPGGETSVTLESCTLCGGPPRLCGRGVRFLVRLSVRHGPRISVSEQRRSAHSALSGRRERDPRGGRGAACRYAEDQLPWPKSITCNTLRPHVAHSPGAMLADPLLLGRSRPSVGSWANMAGYHSDNPQKVPQPAG